MIYLICPGSSEEAATVVAAALQRSCGMGRVCRISLAKWDRLLAQDISMLAVIINPPANWAATIIRTIESARCKILLFGAMPLELIQYLGAHSAPISEYARQGKKCSPAPIGGMFESGLHIDYKQIDPVVFSPLASRPFLRFDFADEWNNLGYGAIRTDDSIWSLSQCLQLPSENTLAEICMDGESLGAYAGLWPDSLLWFNRSVGPVDSQEWRIVELYIAHYAWPTRICHPVISEIPDGYEAAVTMRLDCDEDIESARILWHAYQQLEVPFSLALHSKVLDDPKHHALVREVLTHGGAILSHTATHASNWGGSYEAALQEASASANAIKRVTGQAVRYAVSPFHQTPLYARIALADAGYEGCIGGIIHNDPDYLMARAGSAPGSPVGFIGHSQQCMLHGDCILDGPDPLSIYKQSFDLARDSRTFFGYLDHPFSARYQYGWGSEEQRVQAHVAFICHIKKSGNVLFANESDAMDFLQDRAEVVIQANSAGYSICAAIKSRSSWNLSVEYAGQSHAVPPEGLSL